MKVVYIDKLTDAAGGVSCELSEGELWSRRKQFQAIPRPLNESFFFYVN